MDVRSGQRWRTGFLRLWGDSPLGALFAHRVSAVFGGQAPGQGWSTGLQRLWVDMPSGQCWRTSFGLDMASGQCWQARLLRLWVDTTLYKVFRVAKIIAVFLWGLVSADFVPFCARKRFEGMKPKRSGQNVDEP